MGSSSLLLDRSRSFFGLGDVRSFFLTLDFTAVFVLGVVSGVLLELVAGLVTGTLLAYPCPEQASAEDGSADQRAIQY